MSTLILHFLCSEHHMKTPMWFKWLSDFGSPLKKGVWKLYTVNDCLPMSCLKYHDCLWKVSLIKLDTVWLGMLLLIFSQELGEPGFSQVSWDRMHSGVRCRGSMYSRSLWSIYRTQCRMELGKIPGADCWWGWEQRSGFCTWLYLKCIFKCRYLVGVTFWPGRWQ